MKRITVKVVPNAKKDEIIEKNCLVIYTTAPPENNKANKAVIELLSDFFDISKSCIRIVKGEKSRNKIIEIDLP
jgi:uncharacterized protein (TIGR00251 family)